MTLTERMNQIEAEFIFEQMNKSDFVDYLIGLRNGCYTFGSTIVLSVPKMKKRGNPFVNDEVLKLAKWSFGTNSSYSTRVNNAREREGIEGEFVAQESWFEPENGDTKCAVGHHKTNVEQKYVSLYPNNNGVSFVEYYINGRKANDFEVEQIKAVMYESGGASKSQGLSEESAIQIRRAKLESVKYFIADNRKLKIV